MRALNPAMLGSLMRQFELLHRLVTRNLMVKYQRSALGFLWTLIQPAFIAILLISVFTFVVRIPLKNYWAFLVSGFIVWNFIQHCINAGSYIFSDHANVIRSISLPKELLIVGAVLSRLVEFILELLIVLVVLAWAHHHSIPASFLTLPVLILFQTVLAIGIAFPIAIISVWYHDVQHALPVILMALFYLSPVIYPVEMVPKGFEFLYLYNPFAQVLELYHAVLYNGVFPSVHDLSITALTSLLVMLLGYIFFNRYQDYIAEIV